MIEIVTLVIGLIIGIVMTYYFLRARVIAQFDKWKSEFEDRIRRESLERSRAALKGRVGEQLAPLLPMFKYEPSDARFIGSPIDYVIFRGHSEDSPEGITFVDIKTGKSARLTTKQRKFKEAIEEGNVKWETIHIDNLGPSKC